MRRIVFVVDEVARIMKVDGIVVVAADEAANVAQAAHAEKANR